MLEANCCFSFTFPQTFEMIRVIFFALIFTIAACGTTNTNDSIHSETMNTNLDWIHTANIYEVNIRQHTKEGTFNAFAKELPRLREMGVKILWFMPVTPIAREKMKGEIGSPYAAADYTSINPEFGTMDDFKSLLKNAHAQGFKVIIDWVANHTGWDHRWTKEHPEYYLKDSATGTFRIASGMDDIIELDFDNPATVQAMIEAMKFWVREADIDGFRCDLAAWVELHFWKKARPAVDSVKQLFWLGEYDELDNPDYADVFQASYTWSWMHKTRAFYQENRPLTELDELLKKYDSIGNKSMRAWFTTNHDENSWNGTEYEKYGDAAKALAVFSYTWNGIPLVYNGQELPNHKRLKFFERDPIEWTGDNKLHDFYKTLNHLKENNPALRGGDDKAQQFRLTTTAPEKVLAYLRKHENREVLVILNLSRDKVKVDLHDPRVKGSFQNVFNQENKDLTSMKSFEMPPWEYIVMQK